MRKIYTLTINPFLSPGLIFKEALSTVFFQFGVKPGHTYVNQLLTITHKIYKSFDDRLEVKSIMLDLSTQLTFTCPKSTIETREKDVKYVQN